MVMIAVAIVAFLGSGHIGEMHTKQEIAPAFPITGGDCVSQDFFVSISSARVSVAALLISVVLPLSP